MTHLTDEQPRLLRRIGRHPLGCLQADLLDDGFGPAIIRGLLRQRMTEAETYNIAAGGRRSKFTCVRITAAGRKAIAG
jgi:hypothetical protein